MSVPGAKVPTARILVVGVCEALGASGHLLGGILAKSTGAPMTHVAYRGAAPATTDLIAGRVDFFFSSYATIRGFVEGKQLKLLAVSSKVRDPALPDVPTVAEAGFPALEMDIWFGLAAPAETPDDVVAALNSEFTQAVGSSEVAAKLREQGMQAIPSSPQKFSGLLSEEIDHYRPIILELGIQQ
jgi:tripartite-type tricarboxylate transporter receptor subunit TctC